MNPQRMLELRDGVAIAAWVLAWVLALSLPALGWIAVRPCKAPLRLPVLAAALAAVGCVVVLDLSYLGILTDFAVSLVGLYIVLAGLCGLSERYRFSRASAAAASAAFCLVVPSMLVPRACRVLFVPLALETAMSAYSYLVEQRSRTDAAHARTDHGETLLFLLVNPALVRVPWAMGARCLEPRGLGRGMLRILAGGATLGASVLAAQSYGVIESRVLPVLSAPEAVQVSLLLGSQVTATVLAAYWGHSGAASVRIGWMQLLGWNVPERYQYPFLARSPGEFWQRWNMHWGVWLRRYVFDEAARQLLRRGWRKYRAATILIAVMATAAGSGIIHDFARYVETLDLSLSATAGFVVFAAGLLAWEALAIAFRNQPQRAAWATLGSICGRVVTLALLCTLGWLRSHPALPAWFAEPLGLASLGF